MNRNGALVPVIFALCVLISISNGQMLDQAKNLIGGASECIQKLPQCSASKPNDQDRESKRAYCCNTAAYVRCIDNLISSTCPGTGLNQVVGSLETGSAGSWCEGYTFWTPECLYTNYMIAVIGSAAGLAVLLLIIIIAICCCCCRSKKS